MSEALIFITVTLVGSEDESGLSNWCYENPEDNGNPIWLELVDEYFGKMTKMPNAKRAEAENSLVQTRACSRQKVNATEGTDDAAVLKNEIKILIENRFAINIALVPRRTPKTRDP